ncbi:hypothetical protein M3Y97_00656500 [Aphelenchoides bicaudatus]|nr:hypothetical protein M3Y97_00656500 [Aphelenchoides bicaudatus]
MKTAESRFQSKARFRAFHALKRVQVLPNLDAIYSPTYKYKNRLIKDDIEALQKAFLNVPAARGSVLRLIALLSHEYTNIVFLEQKSSKVDSRTVHVGVHLGKFFEQFTNVLMRFDSEKSYFTVLKWLLKLCNDISTHTQPRPKIDLARDLVPYFMKNRCVEMIMKCLDFVLITLLAKDAKSVVQTLVECFKYGDSFDWIFLRIVTTFSFDLVLPLLDICISETAKRVDSFTQHENPRQSDLAAYIFQLFSYLSTKRTPMLRYGLVDQFKKFFIQPEEGENSVLFIANLLFIYPGIATLIKDEVQYLISAPNLVSFVSLVLKPTWVVAQCHPSEMTPLNVAKPLKKMLNALPLDTLINIYSQLSFLITDPQHLNEFQAIHSTISNHIRCDSSLLIDVNLKFEEFMNDLFTITLTKTLTADTLTLSLVPYLNNLFKSESRVGSMLNDVLERNARSKYTSKVMALYCMIGTKQCASKVISQLLYSAKNEQELKNAIAFARTLKSSYAHVLTDSIKYLLDHVSEYERKYLKANSNAFANFNFIKNLASIYNWQSIKIVHEEQDISTSVNFVLFDGYLQLICLDALIRLLERFALAENRQNFNIIDLVHEWISYTKPFEIIDINRLRPDVSFNLVQKMASIGVLLIRYLPESTQDESAVLNVCRCYFNYCQLFMCTNALKNENEQTLKAVQWFLLKLIKQLLRNVFDSSHELFGTQHGLFESAEQISFEEVPSSFLPETCNSNCESESEENCFQQVRNKPLVQRRTAAIVHSGRLSKQHAKFKQKTWTSVEKLRCSIIVGFCSSFTANYVQKLPKIGGFIWSKTGKFLVSTVCSNALTSTVNWYDWSVEKESVSEYTEIANKILALPLIYDLMLKIAQNGFEGMCRIIPLVKAMFAVVVNSYGSTSHKLGTSSTSQLEEIARFLSLFLASGLLPAHYKNLLELFKFTTHRETYFVLANLWNYIRAQICQNVKELTSVHGKELSEAEFTGQADSRSLISIVTPIIQMHIEELGHLLPILLSNEGIEGYGNEEW